MTNRLDWDLVRARLSATERSFENALQPGPAEIERVYRERAASLAKASHGPDRNETDPVMLFLVGQERYAIELADLTGIVRLQSVTPIPGAPPHIAGLINVRGDIRPLLDLKALFRIESTTAAKAAYALLLNKDNRSISVQVDEVEGVGQFSKHNSECLHESHFVTFRAGNSVMLLSAHALVDAMGDNS